MYQEAMRIPATLPALLALALAPGAAAGPWSLPPEGQCAAPTYAPEGEVDAVPFPFKTGDVVERSRVQALQPFLPAELWENRDRFFYDGMRLEIGPCHRDYSPPPFFVEATERGRGRSGLGPGGELRGHVAGLPFPPDTIEMKDPQAALRWAWNWTQRYDAGGGLGDYRITLLSGEFHQRFEGNFFLVQILGRTDRASEGYRYPSPLSVAWAAGGESKNQDTGNECKFRQYATGGRRPDLFFWSPEARKVVRGTSYDSESALTGCLADASIGDGLFLHGGSPQLHEWRLLGVRDLLAPINANVPAYPQDEGRGFGPQGVSFATDRWDLRRVIVLEGRLREGAFADGVQRFRWYLDLQTLFPLYYAAYRSEGVQGGIGYFMGRWSEDRPDYPRWPDDAARPVRVVDQVASALVDWNNQDSVRFEAWTAVGVPPSDKKLQRMISQSSLRGH
jgi:hypothetical protein